jgi:hypothetical protein
MINIRPLIEQRIKTVPDFREVAGVSDLVTLLAGRLASPACYIYPLTDTAGANLVLDPVVQLDEEHFAVVVVVKNVRDARGTDAADQCFALRELCRQKLMGWRPDPTVSAMQKARGQFLKLINGYYLWMDVYKTAQHISSV